MRYYLYSVSILTTEDSAPLRSRAIRRLVFNPNGRGTLLRFIWGVFWAYPASFQGQVGGFVWQFTILLGLYWATSGLCSALQHIGSVGGLYVGLILAQVAILGHFKAMLGLSGVMCVKKTRFSCMGAKFLNFWCYVACSLWDV